MSDWKDKARFLREKTDMSWRAISEQLGIPVHRLEWAVSEQYREKTRIRVQRRRAIERARKAFGVEVRP